MVYVAIGANYKSKPVIVSGSKVAIILQYVAKDNRRWDLIAKACNNWSKDQAKARYYELKKILDSI